MSASVNVMKVDEPVDLVLSNMLVRWRVILTTNCNSKDVAVTLINKNWLVNWFSCNVRLQI